MGYLRYLLLLRLKLWIWEAGKHIEFWISPPPPVCWGKHVGEKEMGIGEAFMKDIFLSNMVRKI